jgi:predicted Zn-dependent peptidase
VDVLADMVRNSLLDPQEIEKEKNVILNEIRAAEDVPEDVAHELYLEGIFDTHGIARRITGLCEEVGAVNRRDLARFYRARYGPRTLLVGIAGNVDRRQALECLERSVGGTWGDGDNSNELPVRTPPALRREWEHRRSRFNQLHIYSGYVVPGAQQPADYYRTLVFSTLAGESMSSRLFQSLREKHALCYSVLSFRTQLSDVAMWTVYASTDPASGLRLLDMLARELGRLRSEPPSPQEVGDAKNHLRGSLILAREDMETRMKRLVRQLLMMGKALEYDESLERLDSVGTQEVSDLVERRIRASEFHLLAYGGRSFRRFGAVRYLF